MRAKEYPLLETAVEVGVKYGWNRAHKHLPDPAPETIQNAIEEAVMMEICQRFHMDVPESE